MNSFSNCFQGYRLSGYNKEELIKLQSKMKKGLIFALISCISTTSLGQRHLL